MRSALKAGRGPLGELWINLGLLVLGAVLFALGHPSFLSKWGWGPVGFVALIPVFVVLRRTQPMAAVGYGAFYGALAHLLYAYWLAKFHPLAIIIIPVVYLVYLGLVFPILSFAARTSGRWRYLLLSVLWVAYEFLKTLGFISFPYGILGYTQYLNLPLLGLASVTGVWGLSMLLAVAGGLLAELVVMRNLGVFLRRYRWDLAVYTAVLFGAHLYGVVSAVDTRGAPLWRVAMIQHNVDPWRGGIRAYAESLRRLTRQSDEALKEGPDIVIWSETAFVPSIDWHTRFREDHETYELVASLKEYLGDKDVPFLFGNGHGQLGRDRMGRMTRIDYNAAVLYYRGSVVDTYRKTRLVPFTEYFPYEEQLPIVYEWLRRADTHFWEPGTEFTVFESGGVKYSTPICFEDTFGYICREFVRNGAEVIVNLTNDSWSNSVTAMMQHLAMGVFRAVENRRTVVRATNGGMTAVVDPNGRITAMEEPFVETNLIRDVPVYTGTQALYTRWGDWFGVAALVLSVAGLFFAGLTQAGKYRKMSAPAP